MNPLVKTILLIAAIVCAVVFTLTGFDWVTAEHPAGWLGLSIAFFAGAHLA